MIVAEKPTDTIALRVSTQPTTHALSQLLAVLHSRGARIAHLSWMVEPAHDLGTVTLVVGLQQTRHQHLRSALERLVDVVRVEVLPGVSAPPAKDWLA